MEINIFLYCISITSIAIAIYLFTANFFWKKKPINLPPSPSSSPCLPVIGHLYLLKHPIHQTFAHLASSFGPILFFWFGSRPTLMITSPTAAEECLSKNDVVFCNRPRNFLAGKYLGYDYTSLNWAPYGTHWRNLRRVSAIEILSLHRLQSLCEIRSAEVKSLIQRLYAVAGSEVEIKSLLSDLTLNVMTKMLFGKRYYGLEAAEEGKKFREIVAGTFRLFNEICVGDMIPYLRWLDWRKERKFKEFKKEREIVMKELIEEYRKKIIIRSQNDVGEDSKSAKPMIQVLLELQQLEPEYYKDDIILGILLDLLVGGSDTTTSTMEWTLSLLLNHKQALKKAQTEIDNHIGNEKRLLQESDLSHLPYLRCIINETLRMYPAAPNLVPHESSEDCTIGGYHIPRGTMLQVNLWAIQNDPTIWDDPLIFRPERFEGIEGHKIGYKMMPFGSGRRSCPGEGLAIRVVGLTIGSLIQCFEMKTNDNRLVDMAESPGFNLHKAEPLRAIVEPRLAMIKLLNEL